MLRQLKAHGASVTELNDSKLVRSVPEYTAMVWNSVLTWKNTASIEQVQKSAFSVILGNYYMSYESSLATQQMDKLSTGREAPCTKLAK